MPVLQCKNYSEDAHRRTKKSQGTMISAEIIVKGDKEFLKACLDALEPETKFETKRAGYSMKLDSNLKIKVEAQDATAFRAVTTTLTGLLSIIEKGWKNGR
ncbi:MAG: KEOPS complex subunit Pcc1 [DPANN group archaeon]|nr:KEOPS complex subunit Pcc1 [DPANN group archaeon]